MTLDQVPAAHDHFEQLMSVVDGYLSTQLVYVAAELKLADLITEGEKTVAGLARARRLEEPFLRRVLRGLAAIGILVETPPDRFTLSPMGELLRTDHPRSVRGAALIRGRIYYETMGALFESLTDNDIPFRHTHGLPFFDYLEQHPEKQAIFQASMSNRSLREADAVVSSYSFDSYRRIIDIGGGDGTLLGQILAAVPTAHGILFDRPAAVPQAISRLSRVAAVGSWQVIDGDFFNRVPSGGDLYILSRVLHDWNDRDATNILLRCREAMDDTSTLIAIETPLPRRAVDQPTAIRMDLHMLALFDGGRERTMTEYDELFTAAGLRMMQTFPTQVRGLTIIEADTK